MSNATHPVQAMEALEPRHLLSGALIVTDASLTGAFQGVSDWYTRKGYPATVLTTSQIAAGYSGADIQEKIRNAIRDYHANHGVDYVLLGGDDTMVPDRNAYVAVGAYTESAMPTDLYYASLAGTWDGNANGVYGEAADGVSLTYDVVVARYPVRTADQVRILLSKVIAYETTPPASNWATKMLDGGVKLWDTFAPGTYNGQYYGYSVSDAQLKAANAQAQYVTPYWPGRTVDSMFDTYTSWDTATPGDNTVTSSSLFAAMGHGYQFMNFATHGGTNLWAMESGGLSSYDVQALTSSFNVPFISTVACNTGAFDVAEASLSEAFLRSANTGTIAYFGCSRYGWDYYGSSLGTSFRYSYELYRQLFSGTSTTVGDAFATAKEALAYASANDGSYRWVMFGLNYQGDPLVQVYRHDPTVLSPTFASTIYRGPGDFTVSDLPAGAKVTLWEGSDVYVTGTADSHGTFHASIDATAGTMKLTVVAQDAAIYTADVAVSNDAPPPSPYTIVGNKLIVHGTDGDDTFSFFAGAGVHTVTLNGQTWTFSASLIQSIQFDGNGGHDAAGLTGTDGADKAYLYANSAQLVGQGYTVTLNAVADVTVSGGANDEAWLYGSSGADSLVARPNNVNLSGEGFSSTVLGFATIHANGQGGNDSASLYDSVGDDTVELHPGFGSITGPGYANTIEGFEAVTVNAIAGGYDAASLYDSAGDDTFTASPASATLAGAGYSLTVAGFDAVTANASAGGNDTANFHDSAGDDTFTGRPTYATLTGPGYSLRANGFDSVSAYSTAGGTDLASLYDSAGNDTLIARPDYACLFGLAFSNRAEGFDVVSAYASAGRDDAWFYDGAGDDTFVSSRTGASMTGPGYANSAFTFDRVSAYATAGGNDTAALYGFAGTNNFVARPTDASMATSTLYAYAAGFAQLTGIAYSTRDSAALYDSAGDDTLTARPDATTLAGDAFANTAQGFRKVNAYAAAGGNDTANFYDSLGNDIFTGRVASSVMTGRNFANYAYGFESSHAFSSGGADRAVLYDSTGNDTFTGGASTSSLLAAGVLNEATGFARVTAKGSLGVDAAAFTVPLDASVSRGRTYFRIRGLTFYVEAAAFKQFSTL